MAVLDLSTAVVPSPQNSQGLGCKVLGDFRSMVLRYTERKKAVVSFWTAAQPGKPQLRSNSEGQDSGNPQAVRWEGDTPKFLRSRRAAEMGTQGGSRRGSGGVGARSPDGERPLEVAGERLGEGGRGERRIRLPSRARRLRGGEAAASRGLGAAGLPLARGRMEQQQQPRQPLVMKLA